MAEYTAPLYPSLPIFVPQFWLISEDSYLTFSQAKALFLSINGNQTIGGNVNFENGLSTNLINPLASGDTITINSTTNIVGDLLVNGEPISGDLSGDLTTDNIYPISSGDQLNIWTTGILNYYGNRLNFNGQPQYSILYSGETMQILSAGQPCIWNGVYQRCGIWQSNPQHSLDVSGYINASSGYLLNGSSVNFVPSYISATNGQFLGISNGVPSWLEVNTAGDAPDGNEGSIPYVDGSSQWGGTIGNLTYDSDTGVRWDQGLQAFSASLNNFETTTGLYYGTYIGSNYPQNYVSSITNITQGTASQSGFTFVANVPTSTSSSTGLPLFNTNNSFYLAQILGTGTYFYNSNSTSIAEFTSNETTFPYGSLTSTDTIFPNASFSSSQAQFPSRINFLNQGSSYCSSGSMPANSWLYYSVELPIQSCSGIVLVNFWNTSGYWNTAIGSLRGTYGIAEMTSQGANPIISSGISNNIVYITFTVSGVAFYTTTSYYTIWVFTDGFNDDN